MDISSVHDNNSWKFHDDTMMGSWWKRCDGRTDGRTDRRTDWTSHIAAWSQLKTIGHLFCATSSFVYHFIAIGQFKLELQSGNAQFWSKSMIFFVLCDLEIWQMTLKNNRAPLLCYLKLCASFHCNLCIQTGVIVRKRPIWIKIDFFVPCDLEIWLLTLKNIRAPFPWHIKLCASFHSH